MGGSALMIMLVATSTFAAQCNHGRDLTFAQDSARQSCSSSARRAHQPAALAPMSLIIDEDTRLSVAFGGWDVRFVKLAAGWLRLEV
jgi:hypothetical protein